MPQSPLISVIMITYNHERFVGSAIQSVLSQTICDDGVVELIVGDDYSQDGTKKIIQDFMKRYPLIVKPIFNSINIGMHANLHNVIANANGRFLSFLEGDDKWISKNKLERQLEIAIEDKESIGSYHNVVINNLSTGEKKKKYSGYELKSAGLDDLIQAGHITTSSLFIKTECLNYPSWIDDLAMAERPMTIMSSLNGNFIYVNDILSQYNVHDSGVYSGISSLEDNKNLLKMYEILVKEIPEKRVVLQKRIVFTLYSLFILNYYSDGLSKETREIFRRCIGYGNYFRSPIVKLKAVAKYIFFHLKDNFVVWV